MSVIAHDCLEDTAPLPTGYEPAVTATCLSVRLQFESYLVHLNSKTVAIGLSHDEKVKIMLVYSLLYNAYEIDIK